MHRFNSTIGDSKRIKPNRLRLLLRGDTLFESLRVGQVPVAAIAAGDFDGADENAASHRSILH